ncbi:hypothetical protein COL940_010597 [Colletotrichum noveboracense]|nr:hypothetical protein COL940_010597 [Colletotrichum noveboracense]
MTRDRGLEEDNPNEKTVHTSNDGTPLDVKPSDNGSGQGRHEHAVSKDEVDDTTLFYNLNKEKAGSFTAEMEGKLVRKNFWFLLGQTWWIAFLIHLDKSTLSQASTMGIFKDVDMTKKQYNDLFVLAAPWSNKIALVVGTQISTFKPSYLLGLSWAGTATTGYTKKLTVMSTCVVAASAANMISPEFWQPKYKPRYTLPWAFMTAFWFISPAMCLVIRWYLVRENRRRQANLDADGSSDDNDVLDTGDRVVHVYKEDLDLTDRQNQKFIYPL